MVCSCCCFGSVLAVTLAVALNYSTLLDRAHKFDLQAEPDESYDKCGGVYAADSDETSNWTMVYKFNCILYTIMACFAASSMLCVPCPPAAACPLVCFLCAGLPSFVATCMTGVYMFNN